MGRSNTAPRCLKQEKAGRTDNLLAPLSLPDQTEGRKEGQKVSGDFTSLPRRQRGFAPLPSPMPPPPPCVVLVVAAAMRRGYSYVAIHLTLTPPRAYFVLSSFRKRVIHAHYNVYYIPLLLRFIRKLEWKVGTHAWQFQTTLCDAFCATL